MNSITKDMQEITKRINELCEKITLRDVQIIDLTVERDSLKSMYESSEAMNAGLLKEHNDLKGTIAGLAHHPQPANQLNSEMTKLVASMNEANASAVKPAPSRLEIAAMILVGLAADPTMTATREQCIAKSILMATALIKAEKEAK